MKILFAVITTLFIVWSLNFLSDDTCNPKESLAAKINWADNKVCNER